MFIVIKYQNREIIVQASVLTSVFVVSESIFCSEKSVDIELLVIPSSTFSTDVNSDTVNPANSILSSTIPPLSSWWQSDTSITEFPSVVSGVNVTSFGVLGNNDDSEFGLWLVEDCCLNSRCRDVASLLPIPSTIIDHVTYNIYCE